MAGRYSVKVEGMPKLAEEMAAFKDLAIKPSCSTDRDGVWKGVVHSTTYQRTQDCILRYVLAFITPQSYLQPSPQVTHRHTSLHSTHRFFGFCVKFLELGDEEASLQLYSSMPHVMAWLTYLQVGGEGERRNGVHAHHNHNSITAQP